MKFLSKYFLIFICGFILLPNLKSQTTKFGFKGFIKSDVFWDSRGVAAVRQGHFLLYPLNADLDVKGKDINDNNCFHILPIQSRLIFTAKEKEILGAKASAKIEGEFFGSAEANINSFRLRHAFIKLEWKHSNLLVGQFWHPMFIETNYPGTISFNTGVPFIPFSRNPQIRYTYKVNNLALSLTAFSELDFKSTGPNGAKVDYITHSQYPAANFRMIYQPTSKLGNYTLNTGFSLNTKRLKPSSISETGYKDDTNFSTFAATAFVGLKNAKMSIKLQGTYGEDMYNLTMLGGYGVQSTAETTSFKTYTANRTLAFWADIQNLNPTHHVGLLMGYSHNNGSNLDYNGDFYGRGQNIAYVYRISPRYAYKTGNLKFATEFEYTVAAYGTPDDYGLITDDTAFGNLRVLVAMYYFFDISLNKQ